MYVNSDCNVVQHTHFSLELQILIQNTSPINVYICKSTYYVTLHAKNGLPMDLHSKVLKNSLMSEKQTKFTEALLGAVV